MNKSFIILLVSLLIGMQVLAQDSKITVEITKEIDGEKKTFRGEYENEEQMRADPNYQEFAEQDDSFNFSFNQFGDDSFSQFHSFFNDEGSFNFNFGDDNGAYHFFNDSSFNKLKDWDREEFEARMEELGIDFKKFFDRFDDEEAQTSFYHYSTKKIEIEDINSDEFGKRGRVKDNNKLLLDDLSIQANSSDGKIKVRFSLESEGELGIKVYNVEGKEIFNRYFGRFAGLYSETIDLRNQEEGSYLLEIENDDRRLTKKIIIK